MPNNELNMRARELLATEWKAAGYWGDLPREGCTHDDDMSESDRAAIGLTDAAIRAIIKALSLKGDADTGFAEGIEAAAKVIRAASERLDRQARKFEPEGKYRDHSQRDFAIGVLSGIHSEIEALLPSSPVVGRDE